MSRRAPAGPPARKQGTVYTLHFDPPYKHAGHYTGWAKDLDERLAEHEAGRGARLTQVQLEHGGTWRLARAEPGTRDDETRRKERGASRDCPICRDERGEKPAAPRQSVPRPGEPEPDPHMPWPWPARPLERRAVETPENLAAIAVRESRWRAEQAERGPQEIELEAG
jgi:predicted GIY-YIG superfamily endonuclease